MVSRPAVLFVCMGNICRSPLAEAAFRAAAARHGLDVRIDSAGTGDWHAGDPPDRRAQAVARQAGIDISGYRARAVTVEDFRRFTHILALDHDNLRTLRARRPPDATAHLSLLLDHVPGHAGRPVPDPYYGQIRDFETTWDLVSQGAEALARALAGAPPRDI
ncbi:low molecular weight protein-tyrosine-phosphatase [Nguyenibacter vanlangensis]|uniref:protein-tyrosine-phosphatase n=2 Tax=Nguyenibacter vanlangensis TaxID=1216886 RepID=A0ABZ3D3V9_9PROT